MRTHLFEIIMWGAEFRHGFPGFIDMNLPEIFPERPTIIEFKEFSFGEYFSDRGEIIVENKMEDRIVGTDLFSLFTAEIIKQDVIFTR